MTRALCIAAKSSRLCRFRVKLGLSAMSAQCPVCPKADAKRGVGSVLWLTHQHIDDVLIVDGNLRHSVDPEEEFGAADSVSGDLLIRVRDLDLAQLPLDLAAPLGVGTHDATGTL